MGETGRAQSLRDYLCRIRKIQLAAKIVFAEAATQIYRDTKYHDLITFEEDIARIASMVLVIAESPGSLAELGAFSMNETIRPTLLVVAQSKYASKESFIRFGPMEKVRKGDDSAVLFYPWSLSKKGSFVSSSASEHYSAIKASIRSRLDAAPKDRPFSDPEVRKFYIVYWALYLSYASSITVLLSAVKLILPVLTVVELKKILYCLKIVGWIGTEPYDDKEYYFALGNEDPVEYRFPKGYSGPKTIDRTLLIRRDFERLERLPKYIKSVVASRRAVS